jgi:hypothetical protein
MRKVGYLTQACGVLSTEDRYRVYNLSMHGKEIST